jgi:CRISPR-associated protein (TIGR03984 family)
MSVTTLFVYTREKTALKKNTLNDALSDFAAVVGAERATAILYSLERCELATLANGILHSWDGQPVDIGRVFEARVFNETAELRWLNDRGPEQNHRAVILTEQDRTGMPEGWERENDGSSVIETLPQTYLLWGEGTGRKMNDGWSELATARIGALWVPVSNVGMNQRVLLHTVEYIIEAKDGNAVVCDERLVKLEVADV